MKSAVIIIGTILAICGILACCFFFVKKMKRREGSVFRAKRSRETEKYMEAIQNGYTSFKPLDVQPEDENAPKAPENNQE